MLKSLLLVPLIGLMACASTSVKSYSAIDPTEKSIQVPMGSESILGSIKDLLIRNGYQVIVDTGGVRTRGESPTEALSKPEHAARYRLTLQSRPTQIFCWGLSDEELQYNLSVIDNKSGAEVLTMFGADCGSHITKRLAEAFGIR